MRAALFASVLVVVGCHKDGSAPAPTGPVSTSDQDSLWKLAPQGALGGMVVSPRGLQMIEHAWGDIDAMMHSAPELADFAKTMDEQLHKATGSTKPSFAQLRHLDREGWP